MEGEKMIDMHEKHTLHQLYPKRTGWLSLLFLLGNAGLQVYSHVGLSAVIKSSIDASDNSGGDFQNACVNDASFMTYWNNGTGQDDYSENQVVCGTSLVTQGLDAYKTCLQNRGFQGSSECMECFSVPVRCTSENCLQPCFPDRFVQACLDCREAAGCDQSFLTCSGVAVPDSDEPGPNVGEGGTPSGSTGGESTTELKVVYEISFVSSVQDAINGGAWAIAMVVVIFSGIWPYAKNLIMFVSWFVPMTASTRSTVLKNLTRLAKWSLVDVFAVVIILAGVRINKTLDNGEKLIVVAESRIAIYTFCLAAIWDLVQGEWMRFMHLEALQKFEESRAGRGDTKGSVDLEAISQRKGAMIQMVHFQKNGTSSVQRCSALGKALFAFAMIAQIAIAVYSVIAYCIAFQLSGLVSEFEGPNLYEYSAVSIATSLTSEEVLEINDSVPGTLFLMVVYLLCSIIIPLFQYVSILVLTYVPWNSFCCNSLTRFRRFCMSVDIIGGFACLDVFLLSFVVVIAEWDKLIEKAVASQANNVGACASGTASCLSMTSEILPGLYIMIPAVVLGWLMELFFTYEFAQVFHPVEQVRVAESLFGCVVPSTGCGTIAIVDDSSSQVQGQQQVEQE